MAKHRASKRLTIHKKHKILRKVNEHHRQVRKLAKIEGPNTNKSKKDPGIPNLWPFKEELLHKIESHKQKVEDEKKKKNHLKKEKKKQDLQSLVANAQKNEAEFQKKQQLKREIESTQGFVKESKDSSLKAFYREVKKVIEAADVILQVLDARDPMGCRCFEIEQMILERYPNKKIVLILNKIDLIPKENVLVWLKYLRNYYPTLAFKCSTQNQKRNLGQNTVAPELASKELLSGTESLGAEALLQLLKNYSRSLNIKTSVSVGIIGYPNVGKSSLINSLKRTRSVGVGATPGFTKVAQEVHLDKNVKLLDSPGVVPVRGQLDANIILRNVVKLERVSDPIAPVEAILQRCRKQQLLEIYQIPEYNNSTEFLTGIANKRKKLGKGGVADLRSAALSVIRDWIGGKIPFYTVPPKERGIHVGSSIVSSFSEEFNIDQTDLISSLSFKDANSYSSCTESVPNTDSIDKSVANSTTKKNQQQQQQQLQPKHKVQNLRDEADKFNPQTNKSKKKEMKKLKKKFGFVSCIKEFEPNFEIWKLYDKCFWEFEFEKLCF
eukprot:gene1449-1827_t